MWTPRSPLLLTVLTSLALGCGPSPDDQAAKDHTPPLVPSSSADQAQAGTESGGSESGGTESDETELAIEAVIEVDAPTIAPNTVPSSPVSPTPITLTWREVANYPAPLEFVYIAAGLLARGPEGYYELDDEGQRLALRAGLELPSGELIGEWPNDVWLVSGTQLPIEPGEALRFEYELMQLDEDRQWVPREYRGQPSFTGEAHIVRKSSKGGVLVRQGSKLTRFGTLQDTKPKTGPRMGSVMIDIIETRGADLYNISERPTGIYVQIKCSNRECVNDNAKKLPHGSEWTFSTQILRQLHSVSLLATVDHEGAIGHHLLHYGRGGWKLESLLHPPTGLWPDDDGGLWLLSDNGKLLHRDGRGNWHDVALPKGASSISAAMLPDRSELWLAATVAGKGVVFATQANDLPTEPAPAD